MIFDESATRNGQEGGRAYKMENVSRDNIESTSDSTAATRPIHPLEDREMELIFQFTKNRKDKEIQPLSLMVPENVTIGEVKQRILDTEILCSGGRARLPTTPANPQSILLSRKFSGDKELLPDTACLISHPWFANVATNIQDRRQRNEPVYLFLYVGVKVQIQVQFLHGNPHSCSKIFTAPSASLENTTKILPH